jgi:hypothetical protein
MYDGGEWYCSLSQALKVPDRIDELVEARHQDLALALLSAFAEAQAPNAMMIIPSTPLVPAVSDLKYTPLCCDNFH